MTMPALSADLSHPPHPLLCQCCDRPGILGRWQECGEHDEPLNVVVVLCQPCAKAIIEPHPRLYRSLGQHDPWPGCMSICAGCRHRDGTRCTHPAAKANGGSGVMLTIRPPVMCHLRMARPHKSGWRKLWTESATACQQREEVLT